MGDLVFPWLPTGRRELNNTGTPAKYGLREIWHNWRTLRTVRVVSQDCTVGADLRFLGRQSASDDSHVGPTQVRT